MPVARDAGRTRPDGESIDTLAARCVTCLEVLYSTVRSTTKLDPAASYDESVGYIIRLLAVLTLLCSP